MVSNANTCVGNPPGDIANVTNTITMNPRPTAILQPLSTTTCNSGQSFDFTVDLTGIGPWTVIWNDGTNQTVGAVGQQGPTNLIRTVAPTNTLGGNVSTNFEYYVASVSNANTCMGSWQGDLKGTNTIVVNSSVAASFQTSTNDFGAITNGQNLVVSVSSNILGTEFFVQTKFSLITTQYAGNSSTIKGTKTVNLSQLTLSITNRIALAGASPFTVVWQRVAHAPNGLPVQTNTYVDPGLLAAASRVFTEVIAVNTPGTNFIYSIVSASNATCVADVSGLPLPLKVTVNGKLGVSMGISGPNVVCTGASVPVVAHLSGDPPWNGQWSDGTPFFDVTNTPLIRTQVLVNPLPDVATNYTYFVERLGDAATPTGLVDTNISGVASVTVYPLPFGLTGPFANVTNCVGQSNPSLNVGTNLANWYAGTNRAIPPVATYTNTFTPTNTTVGVWPYLVVAVNEGECESTDSTQLYFVVEPRPPGLTGTFVNVTNCVGLTNPPLSVAPSLANWYFGTNRVSPFSASSYVPTNTTVGDYQYTAVAVNGQGCESAESTPIWFVLKSCTDAPTIALSGTNVVVQWYGNLQLQSATNLASPIDWQFVTNYWFGFGTNYWTNSITPPPTNLFFRLYGPTN
jgi:hypothetical protein